MTTTPEARMTTTAPRTRIQHSHWCPAAPRKNRAQTAPDETCKTGHQAITCSTDLLTARQVRTFKSHPGQVKVTWSNGGMTWEQA